MESKAAPIVLKAFVAILLLPPNQGILWSQPAPMAPAPAPQTTNWNTTKHWYRTIRVNPDANLSPYKAIAVGSVAYTGSTRNLKPQESDKLVGLLRDSLSKDLPTAILSTDSQATRALTLNASITRVKRSHPWVNLLTIAAVFVPLDLGKADVSAWIVDSETGQVVATIEIEGCGQIYQVWPSLQTFGQSRLLLKKESHSIARDVARMNWSRQLSSLDPAPTSFLPPKERVP